MRLSYLFCHHKFHKILVTIISIFDPKEIYKLRNLWVGSGKTYSRIRSQWSKSNPDPGFGSATIYLLVYLKSNYALVASLTSSRSGLWFAHFCLISWCLRDLVIPVLYLLFRKLYLVAGLGSLSAVLYFVYQGYLETRVNTLLDYPK